MDVVTKIVSGEQIQSLAEISICTNITSNIKGQKILKQLTQIDKLDQSDISKYKRIFCYTYDINLFFEKYYDFLREDTVLITHNADEGIHDHHLIFLESNKIKKWYCQNRETSHKKLLSTPIGLANSQWPHGNQHLIHAIKQTINQKSNLVFKNFDINTNSGQRNLCNIITNKNGIHMSPHMSIDKYWSNLATSFFSISPPGNGIDCHRIWESLYLKTVPIVIYHEAFSQFKHLPILFVSNWEEVTIPFLRSKINQFKDINWCIKELNIDYWKEKILND